MNGPGRFDPAEMLAVLDANRVQFVGIGGVAVQAWGHQRTTRDLDLLISPAPENLARLAEALRALGAELYTHPADSERLTLPADAEFLARKTCWNLFTSAGGLDLWVGTRDLTGARGNYDQLEARATRVKLANATVAVIGKDDLIALKLAAGRERDLDDVAALTRSR